MGLLQGLQKMNRKCGKTLERKTLNRDSIVLLVNKNSKVIQIKNNILIMKLKFFLVSSCDRSINPVCMNFPLQYE
jgi:hypothetical protein